MITKLVFSGGGIKGISYIGILKYLEENNILENIDTFVGTSVGSIMALLISIGYTSDQILEIIKKIDFQKLQNITTDSVLNVFNTYGIDNGEKFMNILNILIEKKTQKNNITFLELFNKTGKKLIISTTCVNKKKLECYNYLEHPNMEVNVVIRMAISIPLLFSPVEYNNSYYVDGGLLNNFSIDLFNCNDTSVLGFTFKSKDYEDIDSFQKYLKTIIFTPIHEKELDIINKYKKQSIVIDCEDYSVFNFDLDISDKEKLYKIGYDSIKSFYINKNIEINNKWIYIIEKIKS